MAKNTGRRRPVSPRPRLAASATIGRKTRSLALLTQPLLDLVDQAREVHRRHHADGTVQLASLLFDQDRGLPRGLQILPAIGPLRQEHRAEAREAARRRRGAGQGARIAKEAGATRFCMGAAWREVKDGEAFDRVLAMVRGVRALDMEACVTLGMLNAGSGRPPRRGRAHRLQPQSRHLARVLRRDHHHATYQDRLDTLERVRRAGVEVCCGGIIGMGESVEDRARAAPDARQSRSASGKRADQRARRRARHAAARPAAGRSARSRAHGGDGAHPDAAVARAALGRAALAHPRGADPLLPRRRQLDLLRRQAAHHRQ